MKLAINLLSLISQRSMTFEPTNQKKNHLQAVKKAFNYKHLKLVGHLLKKHYHKKQLFKMPIS